MQGVHNKTKDIQDFILTNTKHSNGCHIWTGNYTSAGYGYMHIGGAVFAVRRVVWWLKHGYLPQGSWMRDTCENKLCCNPGHLYDNTPEDQRRGQLFREGKSFNAPHVKPETVALIWDQLLLGDTTLKEAAKRWGTSTKTMRKHLKRYEKGL